MPLVENGGAAGGASLAVGADGQAVPDSNVEKGIPDGIEDETNDAGAFQTQRLLARCSASYQSYEEFPLVRMTVYTPSPIPGSGTTRLT